MSQTERTPKHFVNLTGQSKNFKMLKFPLNQLQTYYGCLRDLCSLIPFIFSDLNYKMAIFLSQTESTHKHFFRKKALYIYIYYFFYLREDFKMDGCVPDTISQPIVVLLF
jgi:hypothetical protein